MKTIINLILMCSGVCQLYLYAQQTPVFSEYDYNTILINPAHAGYYPNTDVTASYSNSLDGVEGAPQTIAVSLNTPTKSKNIGWGASIFNDEIGVTKSTAVTASFGYKLIFDHHYDRARWWEYNPNTLTFGISAGALFYNENLTALNLQNDVNFQNNVNEVVPTLGIGILYNRNQFYVGASNTNLIATAFRDDLNLSISSPTFVYGGYRNFPGIQQNVMIKPNVLVKIEEGSALQVDVNTTVNYRNIIEGGIGYRTNSSLNAFASVYWKSKLRFLVHYNFGSSNQLLANTLGIGISYRFGTGF